MASSTSPRTDYSHSRSFSAGVPSTLGLPAQAQLQTSQTQQLHSQQVPAQSYIQTPPQPNHQSLQFKRVWVRRLGMQATTVTVSEYDIVDDLKSLILQKYPTTLARSCDPADLIIELFYDESTAILKSQSLSSTIRKLHTVPSTPGVSNNSISEYPPTTPGSAQFRHSPGPSSIELQPDEVVFSILDQYYPNGMTINDALVISSPANDPNSSYYQRDNGNISPHPRRPINADLSNNSNNEDLSPNVSSRLERQQAMKSSSLKPKPSISKKSEATTSTVTTTSSGSGSSSNGVLLLPRQFKLPDGSDRKKSTKDESFTKVQQTQQQLQQTQQPQSSQPPQNPQPSQTAQLSQTSQQPPQPSPLQSYSITAGASNPNRSMRKVSTHSFPILEGVIPQINVLIVEDNVINQKILEAFMRRKRIRCSVAKNGKEAVEKWRQGGFHLVLMDIQLPVMSGIEATKEIRRLEQDNGVGTFTSDQRTNPTLPKKEDRLDTKLFKSPVIIVALTASSSSADKSVALAAGCNDFLTKPVNLIWLEQKTIEWGCMQALIDFEGWKYWVPRDDSRKSQSQTQSQAQSQTSQQSSAKPPFRRDRSQSRGLGQSNSRSGQKPSIQRVKSSSTPVSNTSANGPSTSSNTKRYHPPPPIVVGVPSILPPPSIISPARPEHDSRSESQTPPSVYDSRGRQVINEPVS